MCVPGGSNLAPMIEVSHPVVELDWDVDVSQLLKVDCLLNPDLLAFHHRLRCSTRLHTTRRCWRPHHRHSRSWDWLVGTIESNVSQLLASEASETLRGPSVHVGLLTLSQSSVSSGTLHVWYMWSEVAVDCRRSSGLIEGWTIPSLHHLSLIHISEPTRPY